MLLRLVFCGYCRNFRKHSKNKCKSESCNSAGSFKIQAINKWDSKMDDLTRVKEFFPWVVTRGVGLWCILAGSGCHNKVPETEWLKHQTRVSLQCQSLEVRDGRVSRAGFWRPLSLAIDDHLHAHRVFSLYTYLHPDFFSLSGQWSYWIRAHPADLIFTKLPSSWASM